MDDKQKEAIDRLIKISEARSDSPLVLLCGRQSYDYVKKNFPLLNVVRFNTKKAKTSIFYDQYKKKRNKALAMKERRPHTSQGGINKQLK